MRDKTLCTDELKNFPKHLRELRINRGMTQEYFANELSISVRELQHYENGTREPRWRTVVSMRILLNVSWEELLGCSLEKEDLNVTGRGIESITDPDELIRIVTNSIKELAKCNR